MKIIIDECVPILVKRELPSWNIATVQQMGWSGIKNGQLLQLIVPAFEVFITSDKNLRFQQNLSGLQLSIILLPSNQVPVVKAILSDIEAALENIGAGEFIEITT